MGRDPETGLPTVPYPDSSPRQPPAGVTTLTTAWTQYTIDVSSRNMSYVLGGFGWVANDTLNPNGAVFYLDDIQYELGDAARERRLAQPRFLKSFTTLPRQDSDFDFVLRNAAFTYDNALALLAFLAEGSEDSVRRARLIGDAFVYAMRNDRTFHDNVPCGAPVDPLTPDGARLRSVYAAADIALPPGWRSNGRSRTVPIPGFYVESTKTFQEIEQHAVDTGNNAWAAIALLQLYRDTGAAVYLDSACRIANFARAFRSAGRYGGFTGGVGGPETAAPSRRPWASSEHNLDLYALFRSLAHLTGDARWGDDAEHARRFIEAMWDEERQCYLAGTTDPDTRATAAGTLPLDVQAWSILALRNASTRLEAAIRCAEANHLTAPAGFDFNDDRDGVWFEGTAQMAVAYVFAGLAGGDAIRRELRQVQDESGGLPAANRDGVSTGFDTADGKPFAYFRRLHVGATAWNVFAQLGYNPYYGERAGRRRAAGH